MAKREEVFIQTNDTPTLYANSVQIAFSPFDIRLLLGTIEEADENKLVTKVSAKIYMSFVHAKIFADTLNTQLAKIESTFGPITLPAKLAQSDDAEA